MEQNLKRKEYQFVDLLKFLFCLCVVALHSNILPDLIGIFAIFHLAVPFFFIASGFFLGKKVLAAEKDEVWPIIKRYCKRLLKPFLVFVTIIFIEQILFRSLDGEPFLDVLKNEIQYLLFYPRGALWYVAACMVGALLLVPFLRAKKLNLALVIGFGLYCFSLLCNNYYFLIEDTRIEILIDTYLHYFISGRNGLFIGFLLLGIGIKCAELFIGREEKFTKGRLLSLFFSAALLYAAEVFLVWKLSAGSYHEYGGYYLSQLIFVPVLFFTALIVPLHIPGKITRTLRDLSVGIYLLHRPILAIVMRFEPPHLASYVIVLEFALLICLVTYLFKKEPFYSLLR